MEAQAEYQTATPAATPDYRELVAPVAAWLAGLGFQVVCGPLPGGEAATQDVVAAWRCPQGGQVFSFQLVAKATFAPCRCEELLGPFEHTCFAWTYVESAQEVRWLLERNQQFRRATGSGFSLPGVRRG